MSQMEWQGHAGHAVVDRRAIGLRETDHEVVAADEHQIVMTDVELLVLAGQDSERPKGLFTKSGLDILGTKHEPPHLRLRGE